MVVPFSKIAPRTVPGTVTGKDTAVPAVVPSVESTIGFSLLWSLESEGDLNLGSGLPVLRCCWGWSCCFCGIYGSAIFML